MAALTGLSLLGAGPLAAAGPEPPDPTSGGERREAESADVRLAREHYHRGDQAFKRERFDEAYRHWEKGYALSGRPLFLVNMGHAQKRGGELRNARALYHRYLLVEPESKLRADVEAVLREIDQVLKAQDGRARAKAAPLPAPPPPLAPAPLLAAGRASGAVPALRLAHEPLSPEADRSTPLYRRWWVWAGVGGAVALGLATTWLLRARPADHPARSGTIGTLGMAE